MNISDWSCFCSGSGGAHGSTTCYGENSGDSREKLPGTGGRLFRRMKSVNDFAFLHNVTFEIGAKKVLMSAHRINLGISVQYFFDLFEAQDEAARSKPISIPDLDPEAFRRVLEYIYSAKLDLSDLTPDQISNIHKVACHIGLNILEKQCWDCLVMQVQTCNTSESSEG